MKQRAVLVTDGEQRSALAIVRSLGASGHRVHVTACREKSLAGSSKHTTGTVVVQDPLREPERFAAGISAAVERLGIDVVVPTTEPAALALLPRRLQFGNATVPMPDMEVFEAICDKTRVCEVASDLGIAVPAQRIIETPSQAAEAALDLVFPCVLKPFRSVVGAGGDRRKLRVEHASDPDSLLLSVRRLPADAFPLLVQQRVVGPGSGIFLLLWNDERLATFAHRRLREKPPSGGVSVYSESIVADPRLVESSDELLRRFGWQGVAMVEYKIDAQTGTPYLMEVNGRFWGSLQLAIDAGVDFPTLLLRAASGERVRPVLTYRTGVRLRSWWGDVDHLITRLRRSDAELALPPDAPPRNRVVREFLKLWRRGDRSEVLRWSDPLPFLRETKDWLIFR